MVRGRKNFVAETGSCNFNDPDFLQIWDPSEKKKKKKKDPYLDP